MSVPEFEALKHRERPFVLAYLKTFSVAKAQEEAGYRGTHGHTVFKRPRVQAAIRRLAAQKVMPAVEAVALLSEQARASVEHVVSLVPVLDQRGRQLCDKDGEPLYKALVDPAKAVRDGKAHLIRDATKTPGGWKVKMVDSQRALELILKIHGAFDHSVRDTPKDEFKNIFDDDFDFDGWLAESAGTGV